MNLVTRKHAQDLLSTFRQEGTLPLGFKTALPAGLVPDQIDTYTKMFEVYMNADNTPLDEYPGTGKLVMRSTLPPDKPAMQWVLDYRGTPRNGELSEMYELQGTFEEHCLVRYSGNRVDVLNVHVEEHEVLAHALQLDRHVPEASTELLYRWKDEVLPAPEGPAMSARPMPPALLNLLEPEPNSSAWAVGQLMLSHTAEPEPHMAHLKR